MGNPERRLWQYIQQSLYTISKRHNSRNELDEYLNNFKDWERITLNVTAVEN